MMIKAGVWQGLTSKEKMDLLVHFSYHNPMQAKAKGNGRIAVRPVERLEKIS